MTSKTKSIIKIILSVLLAALTALGTALGLSSCGVTKATISRPAEGTSTTVTITTNNPISTSVTPTVSVPQ